MNKQSFSTSKHRFSTDKVLIGVIVCGLAVVALLLITKPSTKVAKSNSLQKTQMAPLASSSDFPSPTPSMPSFLFDSSTDLKAELNKVDPQITSNDFEAVKKTLSSF